MDLSIQKMQPPASIQGKSAAKKTSRSGAVTEDDAVESTERDEKVRFTHGNTAYEQQDKDKDQRDDVAPLQAYISQPQAQLLSGEDLSQLTKSMEESAQTDQSADGLMNLRAYQPQTKQKTDEDKPHFDKNF
ncbi:MAG: hypothetical protein OIF58_12830 [Cohaesibacter sp.]|nr:hypothetical protein [Cohaesibacter sp.]